MKVKLNFPNVQILMRTLDPFTGVLYVERAERLVRGARTVDRGCLVRGSGRHDVQLSVRAGQCGWSRDGSVVRLDVYLQYDTYVQQVNAAAGQISLWIAELLRKEIFWWSEGTSRKSVSLYKFSGTPGLQINHHW